MSGPVRRTTAFGLDVAGLADDQIPLNVIAVVKFLDNESGDPHLAFRTSAGVTTWEGRGMVEDLLDYIKHEGEDSTYEVEEEE